LKKNILAGLALGNFDENLSNCLLVCVTETKSDDDIEKLALELRSAAGELK
jgi:hypothetical protein